MEHKINYKNAMEFQDAVDQVYDNPLYLYLKTKKISGFYLVLKEIRRINNLSQQEFSNILGMNRNNYAKYELGKREMSLELIDSILDKFNLQITISNALDDEEEKEKENLRVIEEAEKILFNNELIKKYMNKKTEN